jgi:ATP-binding cassette subfamily B protein
VLLLDTTAEFFKDEEDDTNESNSKPKGLRSLLVYLKKYPSLIWQLALAMVVGTLLKLIVPLLTQSIVDVGVMNNNLNFIHIFFIAQLMLMIGRNSLEFIRGWLLLFVSTRVGISILTDFVAKIMRLPIAFFNEKAVGEVMQRVEDQKRIETFLSTHLTTILFSIVNLVIYTIVFAFYDFKIFGIFLGFTLLYLFWINLFMKKRRNHDFKRAKLAEKEQNTLVQMIQGMPDIKLANAEISMRWDWELVRAKLFRQNVKLLKISQIQQIGGLVINETKMLIITFLSAKAVLDGDISLGAMLAVQQMLGQTTTPTEQLFAFLQQLQDARISTERINAVHQMPEEENDDTSKISVLPDNQSLVMRQVGFQYPNSVTKVLREINLYIPSGKTTAIVGSSGSGKTTLLKLLIKHYEPTTGEISFGNINLQNISTKTWRDECGVVMSDGIIFPESIIKNIALGDDDPDMESVKKAAKIANIKEWIDTTAMGFHTIIGEQYGNLSQGQKQRLLIARAVYKNPEYLFFDEGTSALDVQNQQVIMRNLQEFFKERTTVVVAHRLSTIKNADQIVVIEEGQILEKGNHEELIALRGRYFELLTTQLESAS